jgi:hypothetical protein
MEDSMQIRHGAVQHRGRLIALGAALAVTLIAIAPGAWDTTAQAQTAGPAPAGGTDTDAPPPPVTVEITPGATRVANLTPGTRITVPAGAFSESVQIRKQPVLTLSDGQLTSDQALARLQSLGQSLGVTDISDFVERGDGLFVGLADRDALVLEVFSLDALVGDSTAQPGEPVQLEFEVTPEMLAAAGGRPDRIRLAFKNEAEGRLQNVVCAVNSAVTPNTVVCSLPNFSLWVLYVALDEAPEEAAAVPVPANTGLGGTDSAGSGFPSAGLLAALGAFAAIAVLGVRTAIRRAAR